MTDPGIAHSVARIHEEIRAACARSSRPPEEVVLIGASKRQPLERLKAAFDAGLRVFGENRVQDAQEKRPLLPEAIDWHFIGPLQSNKARRAAELFSTVHSIDRAKIASALARHTAELGKSLEVFLQFNLGAEATKSGFAPDNLEQCLRLFEHPTLQVRGLMAIPPPADGPQEARRWFRQLRELRDELAEGCQRRGLHFGGGLSMGMSSDFQLAIEEGATHVRVGSALFGQRPEPG